MWIFTVYGFFSVVSARIGPDYNSPVDPKNVMIRARNRDHLMALRKRFPAQMKGSRIVTNTGTDYPYRVFVSSELWTDIARHLAAEIHYDNFKSEVARSPAGSPAYLDALHEVWGVMRRAFLPVVRKRPIRHD